jgi:hypothetical protein
LAAFFAFGATASCLTAVLLEIPGTFLDILWRLNPGAERRLSQLGMWSVLTMIAVSGSCAVAALGLWRRRPIGFRTAILLLAINMGGDALNAIFADDWRTLIGLPIAGSMIWYLVAKRRVFFSSR